MEGAEKTSKRAVEDLKASELEGAGMVFLGAERASETAEKALETADRASVVSGRASEVAGMA